MRGCCIYKFRGEYFLSKKIYTPVLIGTSTMQLVNELLLCYFWPFLYLSITFSAALESCLFSFIVSQSQNRTYWGHSGG